MTAVAQVCDPELFGDIDPENKTNCERCSASLEYMMGEMNKILNACEQHLTDTCETMFKKVITEEGVCYTFNGLDVYREINTQNKATTNDWTLDDGYTKEVENYVDLFPRSGTSQMVSIFLNANKHMTGDMCKGSIEGFKVYLHLPNEAPQISKQFYLLPYHQSVQIKITPQMIKMTPELRAFSVEKRQCYFNDERYLRFFRYYTQNNCEVECEVNLTVSRCGCLRFHMPSTSWFL
jgi:acid-sensing ion channel, other